MFDDVPNDPKHGTCHSCKHWRSFNRRVGWCWVASDGGEDHPMTNGILPSNSGAAHDNVLVTGVNFYCAQYKPA